MIWLAVALAGGAGAACRFVVDHVVTVSLHSEYPWGTLAVNLSGSLLIGAVAGLAMRTGTPALGTILGGGFCGAYTTFSTLVYETWQLADERRWGQAAANLSSLLLGWLAAVVGWATAGLVS